MKSVKVRNLCALPLNKINLVRTATKDFMQKNDSDICFRWLDNIGTRRDVTRLLPLGLCGKDQAWSHIPATEIVNHQINTEEQ